jgi:hypothetical protein
MLLKNVLDTLIRVELANLSLGKPEWSTGNFNYKMLINCISSAYVELHKRFSLQKERITLQPMEGVTLYILDAAHAVSNTASTEDKYIIDSALMPFSNSIAKIDAMYDHLNNPIIFDGTKIANPIYTLNYKSIVITEPDPAHPITILCRHIPAEIALQNEGDLNTYALELPPVYTEALLLYAAGRACANRGAENNMNNESAVFMARFEQSCVNISTFNLDSKEEMENTKLNCRGFV